MQDLYINNLYLDLQLIEDDIREALGKFLRSKNFRDLFKKEVYIIAEDTDLNEQTKTPAVQIELTNDGIYDRAQEDINIQVYSHITLAINVYTSGELKVSDNKRLTSIITRFLQLNQKLTNYYSYGFKIMQERAVSSLLDDTDRRLVRFRALVDNDKKKIYPK